MSLHHSLQEPAWKPKEHHRLLPPAKLQQWLFDRGSLTKKLSEHAQGDLRVEVLSQAIAQPRLSECQALHIQSRQWAVIREVILYGKQEPWVYARTIIPLSTLKGPLRRLHYLGNRPLGKELFADPSMRRAQLEIAALNHLHLPAAIQPREQQAWGRRSVFWLKNKPLLVGEVFLDHLLSTKPH